MRRKCTDAQERFSEVQIVFALKAGKDRNNISRDLPQDGRCASDDLSLEEGFCGMGVAEIRRLKQLEEENAKLKRSVADQSQADAPALH